MKKKINKFINNTKIENLNFQFIQINFKSLNHQITLV